MDKNKISDSTKKIISQTRLREGKRGDDTIRLWENYRDQAQLWRALAMIQIPTILILAVFAFTVYGKRQITLSVPAKPLPGMYELNEVPDAEFIGIAEEFVNLISTYQPVIAERQFIKASEMLIEPFLSTFEKEIIKEDIDAISKTQRSQILYVDSNKTTIIRGNGLVSVKITGDRIRTIKEKRLDPVLVQYEIVMKTIPRTRLNPFGIVIVDLNISSVNK